MTVMSTWSDGSALLLGVPACHAYALGELPALNIYIYLYLPVSALELSEQGLSDDKSLNVTVLEQIITLETHSYFLQDIDCIKIRTTQNGTRE